MVEQQWYYYLIHSWGDKGVHPFPKDFSLKVNVIAWLEFELTKIPQSSSLKPQRSNINPNLLANQLWCIDFFTSPTPFVIPHRLPAFL